MSNNAVLINKLNEAGIPHPLSATVKLPLGEGDRSDIFRERWEALLKDVEEVQPAADPAYIFSYEGKGFFKWCNSRETTVTLGFPLAELTSSRIKFLIDSAVFRLTILLGRLPSGGEEKRDFRAELGKVISEIRKFQAEQKTDLPALRLQTSGLAHNLPHLPGLVEEAARLGIAEVIISPRGTAKSRYLDEALLSARKLGVRLNPGTEPRTAAIVGEDDTPASPGRRRAGRSDNRARMALPQTESICTLSRLKKWLKNRLIREINPRDSVDSSRLRLTDERRKDCLFPWNWTYITENGEINPCPASRRVLGDLREKNFPEIWNGSEYRSFRRRLLSFYPLEECRRCSLGGWFNPYQLTDWIWVGMNDRFGIQMGTGWHEREGEALYRWSRKEATILLKNSGKKRLALVLHLPGRKLSQCGEIWITGRKAGDFSLARPGDSLHYFPIPENEKGDLLVTLNMKKEIIPALIFGTNDHRRLGVAFKGAYLAR